MQIVTYSRRLLPNPMIGSIDAKRDIALYITQEELCALPEKTSSGVIIKFHKPKQQGTVELSLDDKLAFRSGYGIGAEARDLKRDTIGAVQIYLSHELYTKLKEHGSTGSITSLGNGSTVQIYDLSRRPTQHSHVEQLEWYAQMKDKLPEDFG